MGTMPELLPVFCLDDVPAKVLEELVDACHEPIFKEESLISIVRDPKQTEFDRGTERPVSGFTSGFRGYSLDKLAQFCISKFEGEDEVVNITPWSFAAVDKRTADGEGDGSGDRTVILASYEYEKVVSLRVKFKDAHTLIPGLFPKELYLKDRLMFCKDGVYQAADS